MQNAGADPVQQVVDQLDAFLSDHRFADVWVSLLERRALAGDPVCQELLDRIEAADRTLLHDIRSVLTPVVLGVEQVRKLLPTALKGANPLQRVRAIADLEEAIAGAREASRTALALTRHPNLVKRRAATPSADVEEVIRGTVRALQTSPPRIATSRLEPARAAILDHDLQRILINLATNALQACTHRADGRVNVSCWHSDRTYIEVTDNGKGIPYADQERIFELFWTDKTEGSGVGLYVCKQLVERWSGTVDVESRPGHTAFTVSLPLGAA